MLSLCLIAKDEAQFIEACLDSVVGVVDEIIVVDTGSSDDTVRIAKGRGAIVVHHPWADDFAAARNAALDASSGDWILVLDADERLVDGSAIVAAIAEGDFDLGLLPLHNADDLDAELGEVVAGRARRGEAIQLGRLFRRSEDLRWEGRVHETPRSWMAAGVRARNIPADIVHLGNVPAVREARDKARRNLRLLEARCAEAPGDAVAWGYLARERLDAGDVDGARGATDRGWSALQDALARGERPAFVSLATLRAHLQLASGAADEALVTCREARALGSSHPNISLLSGVAHEHRGELEMASADYATALSWRGESAEELLPGVTGEVTWARLGQVRLRQERVDEAAQAFERALAHDPDHVEAGLGLIECAIWQGRPAEAIDMVQPLLELGSPDPWVLAALACSYLGRMDDLGPLARQASALVEAGFVSPHRRELLAGLLQERALYAGKMVPGPGAMGHFTALLARAPSPTPAASSRGLERVAMNLLRLDRAELLEPLFEARAEALLPGIGERIVARFAEEGIQLEDDGERDFVFIGGAGRSGTTLFRTMLSAHGRIWCGPELKLVSAICQLREQWWQSMAPDLRSAGVGEPELDAAVRGFVSGLLDAVAPPGQRIAEKTPHDLLHMATLGRIYPRARFIHVVRDGRAVAASLVKQRWLDPASGEPVWYCAGIEAASRYWAQVVAEVRNQVDTVSGRYLELRYEALCTEPEATMRQVLAFLGEPWDPAVLAHESSAASHSDRESSTSAVERAVTTTAIDRWRSEVDESDLSEEARVVLSALGYAA
ncbi:MAG TPA: sulfotransferase [Myxococcota bacterium]|nr:sulfotransferase [Myxococcota bacterium]